MFIYSQEDVDKVVINTYNDEASNEMLNALEKNDYNKAAFYLHEGANPNYIRKNPLYDESDSVFSHVLHSLWNSGFISTLSQIQPDDIQDILEGETSEIEDENAIEQIPALNIFFRAWYEKGGDLNKESTISVKYDRFEHKDIQTVVSQKDFIYEQLFISNKKKSDSTNGLFSYTYDIISMLEKINNYFCPIKLNPVYKNESVIGILSREAWEYGYNDFISLLDQKSPYFLIDAQGNTPLHYTLDHLTKANYNISNSWGFGVSINKNLIEAHQYIKSYSSFVTTNFQPDALIIKNKKGQLPVEKMIEDKAWLQAIATVSMMIKNNQDFSQVDLSVLSFANIQEHFKYLLDEDKAAKLKECMLLLQPYIEKDTINKTLNNNSFDAIPLKKRI